MANIIRVGGGAGGGLTFTVVGGTTIPDNPKENTVWVNTSTAINNVYAQVYAPANPVTGDVWINTHVTLDANGDPVVSDALTMTVSESPFIRITANSGKQWDGTGWARCNTRVYKNGAWSADALIILTGGVWGQLGQPTTGFSGTSESSAYSFTSANGYMCFKANSSGAKYYRAYIEVPINVSQYNYMTVTGYKGTSGSRPWAFLNSSIKGYADMSSDKYTTSGINSTDPTTVTVDISSASGNLYFGMGIWTSTTSQTPTGYFSEIALTV